MFRHKLHYADGSEAGDAAYADWVKVGETVMLGPGTLCGCWPSSRSRRRARRTSVPDD
jgi:hypothetical protein